MSKLLEKPQPTLKHQVWLDTMERVECLLLRHYPGMPPRNRAACIRHSCSPNCGRVFSTNNAGFTPVVTPALVTRAVRAHIRHKHTAYDALSVFHSRGQCRRKVEDEVKALIAKWRSAPLAR